MVSWGLNRLSLWISLLGVALAFWLIVSYATLLLEVAGVLFGATLLSLAIAPLADRLAHWRIPRGITVVAIYLIGGALLFSLAELLAPVIRTEIRLLRERGPQLVQQGSDWLSSLPGLGGIAASIHQNTAANLGQQLGSIAGSAVRIVTGTGGILLDLLIVAVLTYLFVTDHGLVARLLANWAPAAHRPRLASVLERLRRRLTRWIWAQVLIAGYFAAVYSVGLSVLGVPFAITIGIVGGLLEIVPYLGGALAVVLAVVSALQVSPWLALWVIIFHVIVVELESHVIAPALYGKVIGVHPALMLIALLVGAKAGGVLGVFFAIPVTVVVLAVVQELRRDPAEAASEPAQPRNHAGPATTAQEG
ncbi:AI-2E family transporter [Chloroflexus islandicus]|uniref:AI-2E family transporter n=1 Tax=Chloroflexus islandicus TaxID=1707952 RepID=UPI00083536D3|nr:AI-2E family transporter [Chloroflexus islandicus]